MRIFTNKRTIGIVLFDEFEDYIELKGEDVEIHPHGLKLRKFLGLGKYITLRVGITFTTMFKWDCVYFNDNKDFWFIAFCFFIAGTKDLK